MTNDQNRTIKKMPFHKSVEKNLGPKRHFLDSGKQPKNKNKI